MKAIFTIFKKELRSYLMTPYGWVIMAFVFALQGLSLSASLKVFKDAPQKEGLLYMVLHMPTFWFYFLFIFPLITMRSFAEEEKSGTLEGLLTAPVRTVDVVIAKFSSAYVFYLLLWLPLLCYPYFADLANSWVMWQDGYAAGMDLSYRMADLAGSLGILALMGAFFTAIGILCSSLTKSQIIAGIVTIGILVGFFFTGLVPQVWGDFPAAAFFHYISCTEHLDRFTAGVVDTRPVIFYLSMTVLSLAITQRVVDHRRWKK